MLLKRLVNLRDVKLSKYFRYAPVNAELFTDTFASLPRLRRLSLELWSESFRGFSYFELKVCVFCIKGTDHFSGPGRAISPVCVCLDKMIFALNN